MKSKNCHRALTFLPVAAVSIGMKNFLQTFIISRLHSFVCKITDDVFLEQGECQAIQKKSAKLAGDLSDELNFTETDAH